ncbi:ComEC/Rec2 family competence protein [Bdellovibrio sp. HCB-162]|uniref:ComEC/Rec2 family competence protein n=1 Tax=Bdellovibrio sp. HCB-162 TaxID=3394234 RepID=UPI0039BCBAFF
MKYFVFLVITLSASLLTDLSAHSYVVVWNVGQGQWVTAVSPSSCIHFDMGGEFFPWEKILRSCATKKNIVSLSHWDWDHIGALSKNPVRSQLKDLCIFLSPLGTSSARKMKLLKSFRSCEEALDLRPFDLQAGVDVWTPLKNKKSNEQSRVVLYKNILLPGDSPSTQEKIWRHLYWVRQSRVLILGHHGSATSTSVELLQSLPSLKLSISSARWARYKHPHSATEYRLMKVHIPLLRTEDWGNIWLEQVLSEK